MHYYFLANQGLFTPESYADSTKHNNVDLMIFSNQYFKHLINVWVYNRKTDSDYEVV